MPTLVLNAADLTVSNVTLTPAKGKAIKGSAKIDADAQTVTFDFGKPVQPGSYTLAIDYAGIINTQAKGLFARSEEQTSELQSLMRISYAVFSLKTNKYTYPHHHTLIK